MARLLEAIYAQDFADSSYGFRPGRRPHEALRAVRSQGRTEGIGWIVDADVSGDFDSIDRTHLRAILRQRVNEGSLRRLMGTWLRAGVRDGGGLQHPETGVVQGGGISPVLANVMRHQVVEAWCAQEVQPRLKGRSFLTRFAEDFVIGCELEADARRVMAVLPKRFARLGLRIHPEKTAVMCVQQPECPSGLGRGERHMRRSRIDPLLGAITPGILGDQTQDSPEAPASHDQGAVAMVSGQSPSPAARPIRDAVPEVTGPLPVLWDSREFPPAGRGPSAGGRRLAVLAQPSQPQACDQLGTIPAAAEGVRLAHTHNRPLSLTRSCGGAE